MGGHLAEGIGKVTGRNMHAVFDFDRPAQALRAILPGHDTALVPSEIRRPSLDTIAKTEVIPDKDSNIRVKVAKKLIWGRKVATVRAGLDLG